MKVWVALALAACGNKPNPASGDEAGAEAGAPEAGPLDAPIDAAPAFACTPTAGNTVTARLVGTVGGSAVLATSPPGDARLFVLEKDGRIRIFDHEQLLPAPFLDLSEQAPSCNSITTDAACAPRVDCVAVHAPQNGQFNFCQPNLFSDGEQGLLGLAFHPQYATNHQFFVYFTSRNPIAGPDAFADVVVRYTTSATDPGVADPTSATPILSIPDYASNHNAGMIEFGADGDLYISTGDGGGTGDPRRNAQATNPTTAACVAAHCQPLLGKMLRIDVDHPAGGKPYGIPADNPFAPSTTGDLPEIYMLGLRNPWRWSFDRATGDMWIGDVGQAQFEELDYVPAGQQAGKNFGWSAYEGATCCQDLPDLCTQKAPQQACDATNLTMPQLAIHHGTGWNAIIGGQVYRGRCYPDLTGAYFFTDNERHILDRATVAAGVVTAADLPGTWPQGPSSIHADAAGELYMTTTTGAIYHLEAGP